MKNEIQKKQIKLDAANLLGDSEMQKIKGGLIELKCSTGCQVSCQSGCSATSINGIQ